MVLTHSGWKIQDFRDDKKKLKGVMAQQTTTWDGTITTTDFPAVAADRDALVQALEGKFFRVKRMVVYGGTVTGQVNVTPFSRRRDP